MKSFYKLILLFMIILYVTNSYAVSNDLLKPFYSFFPKISEMEGGDERWLATDITEDIFKDYLVLRKSYSSFNENPEKIWKIQRKKNFKVDIEIYYAKNFIITKDLYDKKIKRKVSYKKKIGFGDIGTMMIEPDKKHYPDADYELVFIDKNFVVSLRSTDGFALMDFADYIETAISKYILNNFDKFFIKKLNISVILDENTVKTEQTDFVGENLKEIKLEGKVFDNDNHPLPFVKVKLDDFKMETATDEDGYYSFTLKFKGKNKLNLVKNFIIKNSDKNNSKDNIDIYKLIINYSLDSQKQDNLLLKINNFSNQSFAYFRDGKSLSKALKFKIKDNNVHFLRDCSGNSAFKCIQIFDGTIENDVIKGTWKGSGGGGKWSGNKLYSLRKEFYISGKNCSLNKVILDKDNKILNYSDELNLYFDNQSKVYLSLECNFNDIDDFYLNKIELALTYLPIESVDEKDLFLYAVNKQDKQYTILQSKKVASLKQTDEPYTVKIDLTDFISKNTINHFLIGIPQTLSEKSVYRFANTKNYKLIRPKILYSIFSDKKSNKVKMNTKLITLKSDKDFASNSAMVKSDGKKDIYIRINNIKKTGVLSFMEIKNTGEFVFKWDTDIFNIYPGIVILKDSKLYSNKTGNLKLDIKKGDNLDIFIYKPDEMNQSNTKLSYRLMIDNEWIIGNID